MGWIQRLALFALLTLPLSVFAADCDVQTVDRESGPWHVERVLLADGKTGTGASTKCVPKQYLARRGTSSTVAAPWDFYRFVGEEGDTCTSWSAKVQDYPINTTSAQCRGTCDAHTLVTLAKGATTSRSFREPLGEAQDIDVTAINCSGGVSVFIEFYYRNESN